MDADCVEISKNTLGVNLFSLIPFRFQDKLTVPRQMKVLNSGQKTFFHRIKDFAQRKTYKSELELLSIRTTCSMWYHIEITSFLSLLFFIPVITLLTSILATELTVDFKGLLHWLTNCQEDVYCTNIYSIAFLSTFNIELTDTEYLN